MVTLTDAVEHKRLALLIVTHAGRDSISCLRVTAQLLTSNDSAVKLAALEAIQRLASLEPEETCQVLSNLLENICCESASVDVPAQREAASAILLAIKTLGRLAAASCANPVRNLALGKIRLNKDRLNEEEDAVELDSDAEPGSDSTYFESKEELIMRLAEKLPSASITELNIIVQSIATDPEDSTHRDLRGGPQGGKWTLNLKTLDVRQLTIIDNILSGSVGGESAEATAQRKDEDARVLLRLTALETLIAISGHEVSLQGSSAPLISVFENVLERKGEDPRIRAKSLLSLSELLGPASISFSKHFVRNLTDKDPETRRVALLAIGRLGPASKRFYSQIIARLEDPHPNLRHLAASTLACTFPPVAASRIIAKRVQDGLISARSGKRKGSKNKSLQKRKKNDSVTAEDQHVRGVMVSALAKLLRSTHRKYAKEFLSQICEWTGDRRSAVVRNNALTMLLDIFCGEGCDTRLLHPYGELFANRVLEDDEDRVENRVAALRLLRRASGRDTVIGYIDTVAKAVGDHQASVRDAAIGALAKMYPLADAHETQLLEELRKTKEQFNSVTAEAWKKYKFRRQWFRRRRGKLTREIEHLRRGTRRKILKLHSDIKDYEARISTQIKKYQNLVETVRRERIQRQYQQHADEVALHDARTQLVDSDKSDSDSEDDENGIGHHASASEVVQRMFEAEERERQRERERGIILTKCREKERALRKEKDSLLKTLDECHSKLKKAERAFRRNIKHLDAEIEDARREAEIEHPRMIQEDHRIRRNRVVSRIDRHERYRRTIVRLLEKKPVIVSKGLQDARWRSRMQIGKKKLLADKLSKGHGSILESRLPDNLYPDPIRLSAIAALRACSTQWKGTYYRDVVDPLAAEATEPNTQIRGAAIEMMTFVLGPDEAFSYGANVVHGAVSQCSVLREGASAGARALGAVPIQQTAKFVRNFQGNFGPTAKPRSHVTPGSIREAEDLREMFNMMDRDGNGLLDKEEVLKSIAEIDPRTGGEGSVRRMMQEHPTLHRLLEGELWTEKILAACDTNVSGCVDFEEFLAFCVRSLAGADPIVAGRSIDLNRKLLLRAPLAAIEDTEESKTSLEYYDPNIGKLRDLDQRRREKGIMQSSSGGHGHGRRKGKKKTRQTAKTPSNEQRSSRYGEVVKSDQATEVNKSNYELSEAKHADMTTKKKGSFEAAFEVSHDAAAVIQARVRGMLVRSGVSTDLETVLEKIVDSLIENAEPNGKNAVNAPPVH